MKNRDLYAYHNEIQGWKTSVMFQFNKGKIKNFYEKNAVRLNLLLERLDKLQQKYFQINEKNELIYQKENPKLPELKEGMLMEDFDKEQDELMDKDIQIIF